MNEKEKRVDPKPMAKLIYVFPSCLLIFVVYEALNSQDMRITK